MVKRVLRRYKYPPDQTEEAIELALQQMETLGESWQPKSSYGCRALYARFAENCAWSSSRKEPLDQCTT